MLNQFITLLAFIVGYYLGSKRTLKENTRTIKRYIENLAKDKDIKILSKKEPQNPEALTIKEIDNIC